MTLSWDDMDGSDEIEPSTSTAMAAVAGEKH